MQSQKTANDKSNVSSTQAIHAGEQRFRSHNSLTVPIVQTSVYTFRTADDLLDYTEEHMFWDEPEREEYGRYGNPTVRAAEAKIASLEHGQDAMLLSSGMGAITCTLLLMLKQGDHLVMADESYLQTLDLSRDLLPNYGIECTMVITCFSTPSTLFTIIIIGSSPMHNTTHRVFHPSNKSTNKPANAVPDARSEGEVRRAVPDCPLAAYLEFG